jgi:hypothetical protein
MHNAKFDIVSGNLISVNEYLTEIKHLEVLNWHVWALNHFSCKVELKCLAMYDSHSNYPIDFYTFYLSFMNCPNNSGENFQAFLNHCYSI